MHDAGGSFRVMNPPFRFSAARSAAQPYVRMLGADSEAILAELGYSPGEIAALTDAGITVLTPGA